MRNTFKKIIITLLLAALTAGVVFLPEIIIEPGKSQQLNQKQVWRYDGYSKTKITGAQVAEFVLKVESGEVESSGYDLSFADEPYDVNVFTENVRTVFDTVFSGDKVLCDYFKGLADGEDILYREKRSILTVIDENPVALNFINAEFSSGDETLGLMYEEKTLTLVSFNYSNYAETKAFDSGSLQQELFSYFLEKLYLKPEEFRCDLGYRNEIMIDINCEISRNADSEIYG